MELITNKEMMRWSLFIAFVLFIISETNALSANDTEEMIHLLPRVLIASLNGTDEAIHSQPQPEGPELPRISDLWKLMRSVSADIGLEASARTIPIVITHPQRAMVLFETRGTVSKLYETVAKSKIIKGCGPRDIAIVFDGAILINDHRTITKVGINEVFNEIQLIRKPYFVSLLEMVTEIKNKENIPWIEWAMHCLSDSSAKQPQSVLPMGRGLICDENGNLIGIDLSHLNLIGTIHLEALPQTVLSLDLSFNHFEFLNLDGLRGKSLEKLNVESNIRFPVTADCFDAQPDANRPYRTLVLSSNRPKFYQLPDTRSKIRQWLQRQQIFEVLVLDGIAIQRTESLPFYMAMLNAMRGVTNKHHILWYQHMRNGWTIPPAKRQNFGITVSRGRRCQLTFDLSRLRLEGYIDLTSLPRNIVRLDLSNNDLSGVSFFGEYGLVPTNLKDLNLQNNDKLYIDLQQLNPITHLNRLRISSNQLKKQSLICVQKWLDTTRIKRLYLDECVFVNQRFNFTKNM